MAEAVTTDHAERILPVDGPVAEIWGRLTAKQPGSVIDTLRAATALAHGLVLVTRNVQDVAGEAEPVRAPALTCGYSMLISCSSTGVVAEYRARTGVPAELPATTSLPTP